MQKVWRLRTCSKRCNVHRPSLSLSGGYGYHLFVQAMYVCVCVCICTHACVVLLLGVINRPHFNGAKQIITLRLMMENAGRVECTYGGRTGKRVYTFDKLFNLATIEISLRSRTHHGSCTGDRQSSNTRALRGKNQFHMHAAQLNILTIYVMPSNMNRHVRTVNKGTRYDVHTF